MRKFKCIKSDKSKHKGDNKEFFIVGNIYNEGSNGGVLSESGYEFTDFEDIIKWLGDSCGYYLEEVFDEEIKEDKKVGKFKVGDVVEIIGNCNGHMFKIGEKVELYQEYDSNFHNENGYGFFAKRLDGTMIFENLIRTKDIKRPSKNTKTITITTSDTTTTITDGTHTTSINRYYTDKHNDMVALEEVVKKYKREMEEIERAEKMPKVGDMVKIVYKEELYPSYSDWLIENNVPFKTAVNWRANNRNFTQDKYKVVAIHPHISCKNMLALIEGHGEAFIFGMEGLEVIK